MKKLLFTVISVAAFGFANAQEFKAQKGDVTTDFSLFSNGIFSDNSAPVGLNNGKLKGRYFLADDLALRAALSLDRSKDVNTEVKDVTETETRGGFGLGLGIEKHFAGTERLSPYVGAELAISSSSRKKTTDIKDGDDIVVKHPSTFGFGGNLLLGADYYIARRVYMGVEAGLGLMHQSTGAGSETVGGNTTTGEKQGSIFNIGTNMFAGFKIGYAF